MSQRKVLLIDDDQSTVAYLAMRLKRTFDVVATNRPEDAVALATNSSPDVVLCDIDMPVMSGGDVAAALAAAPATAKLPVVFLTSLVTPEELRHLHGRLGGRPCVSKQAEMAELVETIEGAIGHRMSMPPAPPPLP